jgi:hypothetical protein
MDFEVGKSRIFDKLDKELRSFWPFKKIHLSITGLHLGEIYLHFCVN